VTKENICLKKKIIGEYDDEKCHLICFLNFHGLLGDPSPIVCICKFCVYLVEGRMGGVESKCGFLELIKVKLQTG
jgi:hypothetical protein